MKDSSFLAELLKKEAMVRAVGEKKKVRGVLEEVKRQIKQSLVGGNIQTGEGVTKSGQED